ncbi:hypothetical protein BH11PAT1_BH11PAT1_5700 [soil metagenome]
MKLFPYWIPVALVITALCGLVYVVGQQSLRQNANDPQIQMAEDIAAVLANGKPPVERVQNNRIDLRKSLSVFSMVFDKNGKLLVSSGQLDGNSPILPQGVLNAAKQNGQHRLTWQPVQGIRIASVVTYYHGTNEGTYSLGDHFGK